jgi:hypothetical protein
VQVPNSSRKFQVNNTSIERTYCHIPKLWPTILVLYPSGYRDERDERLSQTEGSGARDTGEE